jgi:regulator of nonsense transcripts 3
LSSQSRPSRAYLHLENATDIPILAAKVQQSNFTDAKGTSTLASYVGPPVVEYAPFQRLPKPSRQDARQGTIDQDEEFIAFLEQLTNPLPPKPVLDSSETKKNEKVIITPLVQYLKDRKSAKVKDHGSKSGKGGRQEHREGRKDREKGGDKKALSKKTVQNKSEHSGSKKDTQSSSKSTTETQVSDAGSIKDGTAATKPINSNPKPERKRDRSSALSAAQILQRDLGLGGGQKRVRRKENSSKGGDTEGSANSVSGTAQSAPLEGAINTANPAPAPPTTASKERSQTTKQINSRSQAGPNSKSARQKASSTETTPAEASEQNPLSAEAKPAPPATAAFLRSIDSTKGVTEALIRQSFEVFGTIKKLDIDFARGLANLYFSEPAELQAAIAASPVQVADAKVTVVERKTKDQLQQNRGNRGKGNRGGGQPRGRGTPSSKKAPIAIGPDEQPA